jgi:phage shock protein C
MADLRKSRDKKLMGVAGGIAEYTGMDKTVWRAIWVLGAVVMPPVILAYFILGIVMPDAPYQAPAPDGVFTQGGPAPGPGPFQAPPAAESAGATFTGTAEGAQPGQAEPVHTRRPYKLLTKSRDKWLAGVCAGVAEYFEVDPVVIRAIWLALILFAGTGILLYIILAIVMPSPSYEPR